MVPGLERSRHNADPPQRRSSAGQVSHRSVEDDASLRVTRRAAVKARTRAANRIQTLLIAAPDDLRTSLTERPIGAVVARCARLRPADALQPREAYKMSVGSSARRWEYLNAQIVELDQEIAKITTQTAPHLLDQFGVGPDVAATLLITAGGNPERLRARGQLRGPLRRQSDPGIIRKHTPLPSKPRPHGFVGVSIRPGALQHRGHGSSAQRPTNPQIRGAANRRKAQPPRHHALHQAIPRPTPLPLLTNPLDTYRSSV